MDLKIDLLINPKPIKLLFALTSKQTRRKGKVVGEIYAHPKIARDKQNLFEEIGLCNQFHINGRTFGLELTPKGKEIKALLENIMESLCN